MTGMHRSYILMGSNIQPELNIQSALRHLQASVELLAISPVWETPAMGSDGPDFLNLVIYIATHHELDALKLGVLRQVESSLGRVRTSDKNAPRTIDLDILIYDHKILEPAIWLQAHIACPLAGLFPDLVDPNSGQRLAEIAARLSQKVPVRLRPDFDPAVGLLG